MGPNPWGPGNALQAFHHNLRRTSSPRASWPWRHWSPVPFSLISQPNIHIYTYIYIKTTRHHYIIIIIIIINHWNGLFLPSSHRLPRHSPLGLHRWRYRSPGHSSAHLSGSWCCWQAGENHGKVAETFGDTSENIENTMDGWCDIWRNRTFFFVGKMLFLMLHFWSAQWPNLRENRLGSQWSLIGAL